MMRNLALTFAVLFAAGPALGHTGTAPGASLLDRRAHPLAGPDHLLARVAVGLLAAQAGGRAMWALPASFVAAMALGGIAGMAGLGLPLVEFGIVGSVVVLGALVALAPRLKLAAACGIVGAFALFHGHAHGTEMAGDVSATLYAAGFLVATAALHAIGVSLGLALSGRIGRAAGAAIGLAGVGLAAFG